MNARLEYVPIEENPEFFRVRFAADVEGEDGAAIALAGDIVRDKMMRWCKAWSSGRGFTADALPYFSHFGGTTTAVIYAVVPIETIEACRSELSLG